MTTKAPRFCFACGGSLPAGAQFCPQCGRALTPRAHAEAASVSALAAAGGERRQVTVMFADVAGYTRLASTLDPEDVHRLLGRFFAAVDGIVKAHGGTIDKHIGDAVMAVFGAPIAHDNDAERAVHAACAIHRAMTGVASESGYDLSAHIGIACGEVVAAGTGSVEHSEYTVTGDPVNLASRLDGVAKSGETLVSAAVWRAVSHRFAGESAGTVEVRGLEKPVEAWRVVRPTEASADEPPLAGRRNELAQFAAALETLCATGAGRTLLVRGEAGIGKTRLASECRWLATQRSIACHTALVLDFGVARGRGAIADVVAQLIGAEGAADEMARTGALERALNTGSVAAGDEAFVRDLLEVDQPAKLRAAYEAMETGARSRGRLAALRTLIESAARERPRFVVIEDLHWADALTLDCVSSLARACANARLLLLVTTRVDGDPFDARWRAQTGPVPLSTFDLAPLATDEALQLAHAFAAPAEELLRRCVARADGNPLFLVQLLRNASEGAAVPASLQSLVLSRIDRLGAVDKAAIQAAAVIGQRFSIAALRHVADAPVYVCDALVDHHLVRPEGDEFLFAHALICDGAYASLLNSRKRELHARAADWYAGVDAELRARHLDRANDPAAAAAYVEAARELAAALRLDAALDLAERAVALATDARSRYDARMICGELLREAGKTQASIETFEEASRLAPGSPERCRALIGVAFGRRLAGEPQQALAALAAAGPLAEQHDLLEERATIHHTRGNLYFALGDVAACSAEHDASLALARASRDLDAEANALSGLGDACYAQGRMHSGFLRFSECVALARARGLLRVEAANVCMQGHCRSFLNDWDAALADIESGLALAKRIRQSHLEMFAVESLALVRLGRGDYDEASESIAAAFELASTIGSRRYQTILLWAGAWVALARGQRELARERLDAAEAIMRASGIEGFIGAVLCATRACASDDRDEATRALQQGEALLERGSVAHCHLWYRRDAIDCSLAIGDFDRALEQCRALERYTAAEPLAWSEFHVARGRASVRWCRERDAEAAEALRALRSEALRCGMRAAIDPIDAVLVR